LIKVTRARIKKKNSYNSEDKRDFHNEI